MRFRSSSSCTRSSFVACTPDRTHIAIRSTSIVDTMRRSRTYGETHVHATPAARARQTRRYRGRAANDGDGGEAPSGAPSRDFRRRPCCRAPIGDENRRPDGGSRPNFFTARGIRNFLPLPFPTSVSHSRLPYRFRFEREPERRSRRPPGRIGVIERDARMPTPSIFTAHKI